MFIDKQFTYDVNETNVHPLGDISPGTFFRIVIGDSENGYSLNVPEGELFLMVSNDQALSLDDEYDLCGFDPGMEGEVLSSILCLDNLIKNLEC